MTTRVVYDGSIDVASREHVHYPADGGEPVPIPGLDEVVSRAPHLTFTLDYPFERPFEGRVDGVEGITLRTIVDAVRAGFRAMYAGTTAEPIPHLDNQRVTGRYGEAMHVIGDLVIEMLEIDDDARRLDVCIGS